MFVGERCFEGTRSFSTQGIDKAVLNLFRMYGKMGNQEIAFESERSQNPLTYSDVWGSDAPSNISGFATLSGNKSLQVLVYNHHDDWDLDKSSEVTLEIDNLPFAGQKLSLYHCCDTTPCPVPEPVAAGAENRR